MRSIPVLLLAFATAVVLPSIATARPGGNPNFHFVCELGNKQAAITTENGLLVYRYGRKGRAELEIRQRQDAPNVFYLYQSLSLSGVGQQLRFVNGSYSYGIESWFYAGPRGGEGVGFFVMNGDRVVRWKRCGRGAWLTEDHQLDRLPTDTTDAPLGRER